MGSTGDFVAAISASEIPVMWGTNTAGQLGDNTTTAKSSPVLVVGAHSFVQIAIGTAHTVALKSDGSAWAWGTNSTGQCGNNTSANSYSSPIAVLGNHTFVAIAAGANISFGLKSDGSSWGWGDGIGNGLGNGTVTDRSTPFAVQGSHSAKKISSGYRGGIILKIDGSAWAWGTNGSGQIGDGTTGTKGSPVAIIGNHSFISVCWGNNTTCALKADGSAWTWGSNQAGQCGNNTSGNSYSSPVAVIGNHSFIELFIGGTSTANSNCMGLKDDGSVWGWGANNNFQLGNQVAASSYSSPVQVVGAHSFTHIFSVSTSNGALKPDGTLWMWGIGTAGKLGNNTITAVSSPVLVVGPFYHTNAHEERLLKTHVNLNSTSWHRAARAFVNVNSTSWSRVIDVDVQVSGAWDSCL